jgi:16S rRNA (cytosine967-C5)-methyltransferase
VRAALAQALCDAARMVAAVASGRSLADELERAAEEGTQTPRSALIDLTHGSLRRFGRLPAIVRALSHRQQGKPIIDALLWCALYALESGRYADYAVVDQAVRAANMLDLQAARGYVNAVLRAYLRERGSIEARIGADREARHQHPAWWIDKLHAAYPEQWEAILAAGNAHPPMCLRVNRRRSSAADYAGQLREKGFAARSLGGEALLLERPVQVGELPGFEQGLVSVQDAAAQRAAACLELASGQRVLDACAAPGGKSAHILETAEVELTALDIDAARAARISRNLERLGLAASVLQADCTRPAQWWNGARFDRILADVPCTASGVARRHPDLKWLRRAQDVPAFAARQSAILDALWPLLAPGGKLLYVTCSVFPEENERVVESFIARTQAARRAPPPDGAAEQSLPGAEHDGFYYALLIRQA